MFPRGQHAHRSLRLFLNAARCLRTSPKPRTLVGPPDPVSNLRPVVYDEPVKDGPSSSRPPDKAPTHPYLLDEFDGNPADYQWRLERQRLDAFNHAFWTDSNTRFETAKQAVLASLPEEVSPEYREAALSEFYRHWVAQERTRMKLYSEEWTRRNFAGIMLAARVAVNRFRTRIAGALGAGTGKGGAQK